jgi:NADH-quinone oxidoreductase subunit J
MLGLPFEDILFYVFGGISLISAFLVVFVGNPVYSALFLALTMSLLGALFFVLEAYFVSVAQITVYAGAVMVLFVMVLMLFDIRKHEDSLRLSILTVAKVLMVGILCGIFVGTAWVAVGSLKGGSSLALAPEVTAKDLDKQKDSTDAAAAAVNEDEDLTNAEANALVEKTEPASEEPLVAEIGSTGKLSQALFSKYVFAFEAVSLLLLVAIVGAVALAKSKGGTHHVS